MEGAVTNVAGDPVPQASIVFRIREDDCGNSDFTSPRTVETNSQGRFVERITIPAALPSERA